MNRCKDYLNFAIWCAGLGAIVLWPLSLLISGGKLASVFCRADAYVPFGWLCGSTHALLPALEAFGALAAPIVIARLVATAFKRVRRARAVSAPPSPAPAPKPANAAVAPPWRAPPRLIRAKPRAQFGLRNNPH